MFQELMPLLVQRTLLLIVSRVGADQIRINVIPQQLQSTDTDQNDALLIPLSTADTIVWWMPAGQAVMFFSDRSGDSILKKLNGRGIRTRHCSSK